MDRSASRTSCVWKFAGPAARIHVPSDGCDRCDPAKRVDDFGTSDISAVNDMIHSGQSTLGFRSQQAVRIGDDADPFGGGSPGRRDDDQHAILPVEFVER